MESLQASLHRNSEKIFDTSSKASLLTAIRDVKEKTNQLLTEIIENSKSPTDGGGDSMPGEENMDDGEESEDEEEDGKDPENKKMKLA